MKHSNLPYISRFHIVNQFFSFLQTKIASKLIVSNFIFQIYMLLKIEILLIPLLTNSYIFQISLAHPWTIVTRPRSLMNPRRSLGDNKQVYYICIRLAYMLTILKLIDLSRNPDFNALLLWTPVVWQDFLCRFHKNVRYCDYQVSNKTTCSISVSKRSFKTRSAVKPEFWGLAIGLIPIFR